MSADFRTEHFKGWQHDGYVHVARVDADRQEYPLGDLTAAEAAELASMFPAADRGRAVSDPVAFAEARLDEDERELVKDPPKGLGYANLAARIRREIEAGRRILARYKDCLARMEDPDYPQVVARDQVREYEDFVLPNLLVRWADHPDYDQEWKP